MENIKTKSDNKKENSKNVSSSVSIRKYKTSLIKPFYQSLEDVIGLRDCQTYYPIMNKYIFIDNYQKNLKNYLFETKYQCIKIFNKETIDEESTDKETRNSVISMAGDT